MFGDLFYDQISFWAAMFGGCDNRDLTALDLHEGSHFKRGADC